jgi:hypothetical protein
MNKLARLDQSGFGPESAPISAGVVARPSRAQVEQAVSTLIRWSGDDPAREGLAATPARVARAYEEWFSGYDENPDELLQRTFEEVAGYDEMVLMRDIRFVSHCEHHMAPITGGCISAICRATASWASRNWPASSIPLPSGCRSRSG